MLAAGLLKAPDQRRRIRIQKQDPVVAAHALDRVQRIEQLLEIPARAHIGHKRDALVPLGRGKAYLGKARDERDGQVIHAIIPQVLKRGDRAALARARHTRNNQKIHRFIPLAHSSMLTG